MGGCAGIGLLCCLTPSCFSPWGRYRGLIESERHLTQLHVNSLATSSTQLRQGFGRFQSGRWLGIRRRQFRLPPRAFLSKEQLPSLGVLEGVDWRLARGLID